MPNIINLEEAGWKTPDYIDVRDREGVVHQHLVKVAEYVSSPHYKSEMTRAESERSFVGSYEYAPGGWITAHSHPRHEQWYYIIKGKGLFKVGDEEKMAEVGTVIFMPRNVVHSYKVVGDEPLRFLNVGTFLSEPSEGL